MDNKWKVDKEELDKLILTQTDVTTNNNKAKSCRELIYTLTKNGVVISTYEVWIGGIGAEAVVSYLNCFYDEKDEQIKKQYVGKGYTTRGLIMLCNEIFQNNLAPFVRLDIKPDNIASKAIAKKVGFNQADEMHYELLNPKAEELLTKLIKENAYKPYTSTRLSQQLEYVKMRMQQENTKKH